MKNFKRVAIIGNGGGGKTTLAKNIAKNFDRPLTHVDSIQFLPNWGRRPVDETRNTLNQIADQENWVIDGFGPMDAIEYRFSKADTIVFVDFPLWRHYLWASKRCLKAYKENRAELPQGCSEKGLKNSMRLFKIMWMVHQKIRPQLQTLLSQPHLKEKLIRIHTLRDWNKISQKSPQRDK